MSEVNGRDEQQKAVKSMLLSFSREVLKCHGNAIELDSLTEHTAEALCRLINAQTTAALVSFHVMMKKELARILDDALSKSGKEIIEAFKNKNMSGMPTKKTN